MNTHNKSPTALSKSPSSFFAEHEGPAAEVINAKGRSPIVLICEHASNFIPDSLGGLGLSPEGLISHAAWDLGVYDMACKISELLDAPLIASRVSRLAYDCNRAPESGIGIPSKSETIEVPGNKNLSEAEINDRVTFVYEPFHELIEQTINDPQRLAFSEQHYSPLLITLHSFTPVFFDEVRTVELGILHDKDDRFAKLMMLETLKLTKLKAEFNSPYDISDNVMHTINKHSKEKGLLNVMIEVKNDLLSNPGDIQSVAISLSKVIKASLENIQNKFLEE